MRTKVVHWDKRRAEDPLTMLRRPDLRRLCARHGIPFNASLTTAREMRLALREAGITIESEAHGNG